VPAIDAALLHDFAAILRGKSAAAEVLRNRLHSVEPRAAAVFDIFGSDLPDAYFDGVVAQNRQRDISRDVEL
jgi:hypothetical protein